MIEGINIDEWNISVKDKDIKVRIWDFGGQEMLYATHKFFLTKRSLYILLWFARKENPYDQVHYWLSTLSLYAKGSPVLIVQNRIDEAEDSLPGDIKEQYPDLHLCGFEKISALKCKDKEFTLLADKIKSLLAQLPLIDQPFNLRWHRIKDMLAKETGEKNYIEGKKYLDICHVNKEKNKTGQETLLGFLHDLGIVLNYRTMLEIQQVIQDTFILNPAWITNGIYKVINYKMLQNRVTIQGSMIYEVLTSKEYPKEKIHFYRYN